MKALDIRRHFVQTAAWLDPDRTADRLVVGDPEKEVRRCLVTWISSLCACRAALDRRFDMLITHEPTFYDNWDRGSEGEPEPARRKRALLEESGLVVLRIHDTWDCFPDDGVPWAWARFLGFAGRPTATADRKPYPESVRQGAARPPTMLRFDGPPTTAGELARRVAARTAALGEPVIQFLGSESAPVSRIGIGTGCICSPRIFMEMGCDASIVCDDGTSYWQWLQLAEDAGHPVIRVNHGTAEEPAMMTLAHYVSRTLPGVEAEYLPHVPAYRAVRAD